MADIEKTIKGLECCYCNYPKTMDCNNCPYGKICYHDKACSLMLRDALELLKEQQQKKNELLRCFDKEIESAREMAENCGYDGNHSGVAHFKHEQNCYQHAKSIIENMLMDWSEQT